MDDSGNSLALSGLNEEALKSIRSHLHPRIIYAMASLSKVQNVKGMFDMSVLVNNMNGNISFFFTEALCSGAHFTELAASIRHRDLEVNWLAGKSADWWTVRSRCVVIRLVGLSGSFVTDSAEEEHGGDEAEELKRVTTRNVRSVARRRRWA